MSSELVLLFSSQLCLQAKLAQNIKENLKCQLNRWEENKITSSEDISYLEVQLDTLKSLKREAISLSTKVDWTVSSLGVSQLDLEKIIVEVSQTLQEAKRTDRQRESKDRKLCDQISSTGPPLSLPKIHSPTDILKWMKIYKQVIQFVHSDLTKLSLIKNSLNSKDRKSTEHLNSVGSIIILLTTNIASMTSFSIFSLARHLIFRSPGRIVGHSKI